MLFAMVLCQGDDASGNTGPDPRGDRLFVH